MGKSYHVVVNPVSGAGAAPKFVDDHVRPILDAAGISYDVHHTRGVDDAGRIGRELIAERDRSSGTGDEPETMVAIIGGGDGTAHELMEGVLESVRAGARLGRWEIVVLPLGTANALHSTLFPLDTGAVSLPPGAATPKSKEVAYALASLALALGDGEPRRLPVAEVEISRAESNGVTASQTSGSGAQSVPVTPTAPVPAHIVLSTALHAAILADSEALRDSHPGLDRFKMAAAKNISEFFPANVRLLPSTSGGVRQYHPQKRDWAAPYTADDGGDSAGAVALQGPFTYLLSVTTTPRLEPTFVIAPTLETHPPPEGEDTMDVVVLRPLRDPRVSGASDPAEAAERWAARAKEVLGAAYDHGAHAALVYGSDGTALPADSTAASRDAKPIVEIFRCAGFEWSPTDPNHAKSHTVCADGSLYTVPANGTARAHVRPSTNGEGFYVWG